MPAEGLNESFEKRPVDWEMTELPSFSDRQHKGESCRVTVIVRHNIHGRLFKIVSHFSIDLIFELFEDLLFRRSSWDPLTSNIILELSLVPAFKCLFFEDV